MWRRKKILRLVKSERPVHWTGRGGQSTSGRRGLALRMCSARAGGSTAQSWVKSYSSSPQSTKKPEHVR